MTAASTPEMRMHALQLARVRVVHGHAGDDLLAHALDELESPVSGLHYERWHRAAFGDHGPEVA